MSVPPRREPDTLPKNGADSGDDDQIDDMESVKSDSGYRRAALSPNTDDQANVDTDPLPLLGPYGRNWGGVPGIGIAAGPERVDPFVLRQRAQLNERPPMGEVELPVPVQPFAFPASSPARAVPVRRLLLGLGALAVVAAVAVSCSGS
jgi:hypothetical protein